ncbi:MAG: class I SAM-dependent methyltransferase [Bryobacteraceae bacterium]
MLPWDGLRDDEILEIGCGTGAMECRGIGTDLDWGRVRVAHQSGRTGVATDGRSLPFRNATLKIVYCEGVLHHINDPGATAVVSEMLRTCRPDGCVYVMDSVWPRSAFRVLPVVDPENGLWPARPLRGTTEGRSRSGRWKGTALEAPDLQHDRAGRPGHAAFSFLTHTPVTNPL